MKKFLALLTVICMLMLAVTATAEFNAGTYTAEVMSIKGPMVVSVTLSEDAITDIQVVSHCDTPVTSDVAIERITAAILENQTVAVDMVAGATGTSAGLLSGVRAALKEAGVDVAALSAKPEAPARTVGEIETFDVVVVGAGGAGTSAASQLTRDSNLKVLVLEKLPYIGGSTRYSGGAIWMRGTERNTEIDFEPEYLVEFMEGRSNSKLNEPLLLAIGESIPDTMGYYLEKGLPIKPENGGVGFSGSKLYLESPDNEGAELVDFLGELARNCGAEVRTDSPVTSLVIEDGAVVGVNVSGPTSDYTVMAKKVILATGGFTQNEAMIEEIAPNFTRNVPFTGPGGKGDGITMTRELNVPIVGEGMMAYKCLNLAYGYYGDIGGLVGAPSALFNLDGQRFCNEKMFYGELTYPLNAQPEKAVWGLVDSNSNKIDLLEIAVERGLIKKVDTIEEAAAVTGMNAENLVASVAKYNADYATGNDDPDFGVPNARMIPILDGPFYVVPVHPGFIGSIPGLLVNERTEVLNADGEVIPNLYACGELTFGNVFNKFYPASGTGVGMAVYTGAISGKEAKAALGE